MSCDLVGSTSHKQSADSTDQWITDFLGFYYKFPARVRENLDDVQLSERLTFWKAVGDELLFTLDVHHETDVFKVVNAWIAAMDQYEKELSTKNKMKAKGGAFIATFPHPDYEVAVPTVPVGADSERDVIVQNESMKKAVTSGDSDLTGRPLVDFLGPSIDTGFRVISVCSQRYFTISLEVAWAMAYHQLHHARSEIIDGFLLLEERSMKGVWEGREYPVFALDRQYSDKIVQHIGKVRGNGSVPLMEVDRLATACTADQGWPSSVYFPSSNYELFKCKESYLRSEQDKLNDRIDNSGESIDEFTFDGGKTDSSVEDSSALDIPSSAD